jgi:hypothetical protein
MKRFGMVIVLIAATAVLVGSCGDEADNSGTTPSTSDAADQDPDPDRVQDRERIQQVVDDTVAACGDQDRDRLRDQVQSGLRGEIDGAAYAWEPGTAPELLDEEVTVDGDQAEVRSRLRVRVQGEETQLEVRWRLRYEDGDWHLSELPPCLEGGATPGTVRDQIQNQDQARNQG